jgi:basic membrane protein A
MLKRVDVVVYETIRSVLGGTFRGGVRTFGVREGGIDWVHDPAHGSRLPRAVVERVESLRRRIGSGDLVVEAE